MSVIFNEPGGLSNPSQQNNVFQFVQTTKPTERSAGVALVAGDRWYKPTDNSVTGTTGLWIWNGSLWVSSNSYTFSGYRTSGIAAPNYSTATPFSYPIGESILLTKAVLNLTLPTPGDANNYYNFRVSILLASASNSPVFTSTTKYFVNTQNAIESLSILVPPTIASQSSIGILFTLVAVGTISAPTVFSASCTYRRIHP